MEPYHVTSLSLENLHFFDTISDVRVYRGPRGRGCSVIFLKKILSNIFKKYLSVYYKNHLIGAHSKVKAQPQPARK